MVFHHTPASVISVTHKSWESIISMTMQTADRDEVCRDPDGFITSQQSLEHCRCCFCWWIFLLFLQLWHYANVMPPTETMWCILSERVLYIFASSPKDQLNPNRSYKATATWVPCWNISYICSGLFTFHNAWCIFLKCDLDSVSLPSLVWLPFILFSIWYWWNGILCFKHKTLAQIAAMQSSANHDLITVNSQKWDYGIIIIPKCH